MLDPDDDFDTALPKFAGPPAARAVLAQLVNVQHRPHSFHWGGSSSGLAKLQ